MLRVLAVIVLVAASIRLAIALLEPVLPYLLAALVILTLLRLASWYRGRW